MVYDGNPAQSVDNHIKYVEKLKNAVRALRDNADYEVLHETDKAVLVVDPAQNKSLWIQKKWLRRDGTLSSYNIEQMKRAPENSGQAARKKFYRARKSNDQWETLCTGASHVVNLFSAGNYVNGRITVYSPVLEGAINSSVPPEEQDDLYMYELAAAMKSIKIAVYLRSLLPKTATLCLNLKVNEEFFAQVTDGGDCTLTNLAQKYRLGFNLINSFPEVNPANRINEKNYNSKLTTLLEQQKLSLLEPNPARTQSSPNQER